MIRQVTQLEYNIINNDKDLDTLDSFWCIQELEDSVHDFSDEELNDLIIIGNFYYSMTELSNCSDLMDKINSVNKGIKQCDLNECLKINKN